MIGVRKYNVIMLKSGSVRCLSKSTVHCWLTLQIVHKSRKNKRGNIENNESTEKIIGKNAAYENEKISNFFNTNSYFCFRLNIKMQKF